VSGRATGEVGAVLRVRGTFHACEAGHHRWDLACRWLVGCSGLGSS